MSKVMATEFLPLKIRVNQIAVRRMPSGDAMRSAG